MYIYPTSTFRQIFSLQRQTQYIVVDEMQEIYVSKIEIGPCNTAVD